ncbi:hypothetical protein HU761_25840 [Pseudomonas sp. SWRI59]|uniref:hypothetical protein n=1 Tax=Pseudomonas TaxID=286 RepID=UPI0016480C09|nr:MULTISPECIES: hypothetical protein [unclassified Pseudomonas]MBC3483764.1 hypothetical protein [Pseudomonas sp. SWRI77]MBC3504808.1 hypothetical protein [Pseudomonas sp. SWRI59]MBC3508996.1 hypothetical protein [Pseudomonas sp. SWRI68]UVL01559.1 hypothetical protein LOY26_13830 [Pseudomonas sp. B21-047]
MAWRKKLETFQKRFTPRHRRIVGGAVMAVWAIGVVVHPGQYLLALSIPGVIIFMSAWPPELDGKP